MQRSVRAIVGVSLVCAAAAPVVRGAPGEADQVPSSRRSRARPPGAPRSPASRRS